jgi:hypothetical protein
MVVAWNIKVVAETTLPNHCAYCAIKFEKINDQWSCSFFLSSSHKSSLLGSYTYNRPRNLSGQYQKINNSVFIAKLKEIFDEIVSTRGKPLIPYWYCRNPLVKAR